MTINWDLLEQRVIAASDIAKAVKKVKNMPDSVDHGHVPAVFPIDPNELPPIPEGSWDKAKLKTVKFKRLFASNQQLRRDDLLWHVQNPGKSRFDAPMNSHPQVFQYGNGDQVTVDGDHRMAAMKLLGIKKELAWVLKAKNL